MHSSLKQSGGRISSLAAPLQNRHLVGPTNPSLHRSRSGRHDCSPPFPTSLLAAGLVAFATGASAETEPNGLALLKAPYASSLAGSYLAGRSADVARDLRAAATYFTAALGRDPDNPILLERVLVLRIANGEIDQARDLADRLVAIDRLNPLARLLRSAQAFKHGEYDLARQEIEETAPAPLAILTSGLLTAWSEQATGKVDEAIKTIQGLSGPSWYGIFQDYHQALIADLAGRKDEAVERITAAFNADGSALRVVEAYGVILARAGEAPGRDRRAPRLRRRAAQPSGHRRAARALEAGVTPEPVVATPAEGAAEVLYGLGAAIGADQGTELPAAYLHLSRYLKPGSDLTLMALGDLLFGADRCEDALQVYDLVPAAPSSSETPTSSRASASTSWIEGSRPVRLRKSIPGTDDNAFLA